jgi:hypothetical protein
MGCHARHVLGAMPTRALEVGDFAFADAWYRTLTRDDWRVGIRHSYERVGGRAPDIQGRALPGPGRLPRGRPEPSLVGALSSASTT